MAESPESTAYRGTLRDFLRILFRRRWVAIATVGATVGAILYLILTAEPTFQSYSKLLVNRANPASAFSTQIYFLSWEEELNSELETVRSARIYLRAEEILADYYVEMGRDPQEAPQIDPDRIESSTPGRSSIIYIFYRGADTEDVQLVVKALTQAYREFRTESRPVDPTSFLQQELADLEEEIATWESKRADFLSREGAVQLPEERKNLLDTKRDIQTDLTAVRSETAARQARLTWTRSLMEPAEDFNQEGFYPFGEPNMHGEPILLTLRKMILDTRSEYFEAKAQYTESHPTVLALNDRLTELGEALEQEAQAYAGFLEAMVGAAQAQERSLQASLDYINEQLALFPDREAQLLRLDRTIESLRTTYEALVQRRIEAMSARMGSNRWEVVVLEDASEAAPVRTQDYVRLAVFPLFSLLVGIALAFLMESLDHSLKDRMETEAHLKVPVLATVSRFKR